MLRPFGMAVLLAGILPLAAVPEPSLEYQVKAAFLLNFTRFIDWPARDPTDEPFTICVIGEDPFGDALDRMVKDEFVNGRRLAVQRPPRESAKACQVIYVSSSARDVKDLLGKVGPEVLTVGEGAPFLRNGGVIAFVIDDRRVRFDVNLSAARSQNLNISSRLLAVARAVEK